MSIAYGPDGRALTQDLPEIEALIYCKLNMDRCVFTKPFIDCVGQSSRPDILSLAVDVSAKEHVNYCVAAKTPTSYNCSTLQVYLFAPGMTLVCVQDRLSNPSHSSTGD